MTNQNRNYPTRMHEVLGVELGEEATYKSGSIKIDFFVDEFGLPRCDNKPDKQYDLQTIQQMCSELGREIGYLDNVIEMLEKVGQEGCERYTNSMERFLNTAWWSFCPWCGRALNEPDGNTDKLGEGGE